MTASSYGAGRGPASRLAPPHALSSQARVARALGIEILTGTLRPGDIVPNETELMTRFGISRTVLREVMKTLAAKGMVQPKTRVGTRVLDPEHWTMFDADVIAWRIELGMDAGFLKSLFEVRLALEPAAAALAAERRTDADVTFLEDCVSDMRRPGHSRESYALIDNAFHLAVASASGNPFMRSMGAVIEAALTASFTLHSPVDDPERQRATADAHERIVDAIREHDPHGAEAAMLAVITEGMNRRALDPRAGQTDPDPTGATRSRPNHQ